MTDQDESWVLGSVLVLALLVVALFITLGVLAVRAERRAESACEKRGGIWQKNPDDCHTRCTVRGSHGACMAWGRVCNKHCAMPKVPSK